MKLRTYRAFTFSVLGLGSFPFDMLRYDRCVFDGSEDVNKAFATDVVRTIQLIAYVPVGYKLEPTTARWASFGWKVVEGSARIAKE